ncbi:hypothetical protein AOLI_G00123130 [Acnodon oligacanthus]
MSLQSLTDPSGVSDGGSPRRRGHEGPRAGSCSFSTTPERVGGLSQLDINSARCRCTERRTVDWAYISTDMIHPRTAVEEASRVFAMAEVIQGYYQSLQGFKLVYPLLGVAHADLTQGLILVPPGTHVLHVQDIILGLLGVISRVGQL